MSDSASDPVDDLLVMQAQDGDRKSMEELVRRWQRRLWAHASPTYHTPITIRIFSSRVGRG